MRSGREGGTGGVLSWRGRRYGEEKKGRERKGEQERKSDITDTKYLTMLFLLCGDELSVGVPSAPFLSPASSSGFLPASGPALATHTHPHTHAQLELIQLDIVTTTVFYSSHVFLHRYACITSS